MIQIRLKQRLTSFAKDKRGNFAVIFALTLVPVMALIGGAIDFRRAFQTKEALRTCMESAALALPSIGVGANATDSEINQKVNEFILHQPSCAKFVASTGSAHGVHATFTGKINRSGTGKGRINVSADATIDTYILGLIGVDQISLGSNGGSSSTPVQIEVQANTKVEIALVLDTTGSMGGSKMTALKSAVTTLVDNLKTDDPDCAPGTTTPCKHVRMGMVPFSYRINIGTPNDNTGVFKVASPDATSRARVPTWLSAASGYGDLCGNWGGSTYCATSPYKSGSNLCAKWGSQYYCDPITRVTNDITCITYANVEFCASNTPDLSNWTGCVLARDEPYYTNNSRAFTNDNASLIPTDSTNCSFVKPIERITGDLNYIHSKVQNLNASGSTNTAIGLEWGWRLISKGVTQGIDFDETGTGNAEVTSYDDQEWQKVIILMTDGQNTTSQYINSDTATDKLCTNIKNENVKIFTIAFQAGSTAENLMKNCATKHSYYFNASSPEGLTSAFSTIAKEISHLRVVK